MTTENKLPMWGKGCLPVIVIFLIPFFFVFVWFLVSHWTRCSGFDPCSHSTGHLTSTVATFAGMSFLLWPISVVVVILKSILSIADKKK